MTRGAWSSYKYRLAHPDKVADLRSARVESGRSAAATARYREQYPEKARAAQAVANEWRYKRAHAYVRSEKEGKPCADCGALYPSYVLDFDHVRGEKEFAISQHQTRSPEQIAVEIAKCDLVCANCHRIRTHGNRKAA